jgi:hypothetical protein
MRDVSTGASTARALRTRASEVGPAVAAVLEVAAAAVEVLPSVEDRHEAAVLLRRVAGSYPLRAGAEARVADRLLDFARDLDPIA